MLNYNQTIEKISGIKEELKTLEAKTDFQDDRSGKWIT